VTKSTLVVRGYTGRTVGKNTKGHKKTSDIKEIQIKTTLRFHLIPVRIAIIKNTTNNKC
jgi:hypothetical protein